MSLTEIFEKVRRYDQNAHVIFDAAEPIGCPTDLVMPPKRWLGRFRAALWDRDRKKNSLPLNSASRPS
jgi:hypothetical protein